MAFFKVFIENLAKTVTIYTYNLEDLVMQVRGLYEMPEANYVVWAFF